MAYMSRRERFDTLFPGEPSYRWKQVQAALFSSSAAGWAHASSLPAALRGTLSREIPWLSCGNATVHTNAANDTYKAALTLADGKRIESVLMGNRRGQWTVCVSSQVGCAMRCAFCATGKMGFFRNLHADEIVDQYRFWTEFLTGRGQSRPLRSGTVPDRISNVVFMGMGEPLANYEEVKTSLNTLLAHTDLGPTRITVSTVGHLPRLEDLLSDKAWPPVRLAVSLHSADAQTRKRIVPTSYDRFLTLLSDWAVRYLARFGNRRHHLTFEYVMLDEVNDTPVHADKLAAFVKAIGEVKVNLIPYNFTGMEFRRSADARIRAFAAVLEGRGVTATVRRTMGDDIAAACGQLIIQDLPSAKASATVGIHQK
jgi:23S rRNA (adenine2503-C2)-methyltransferase